MKKTNQKYVGLLLLWVCLDVFIIYLALFTNKESNDSLMPYSGLPQNINMIVMGLLVPMIMYLIFALICPIVLFPAFMLVKRLFMRQYENGYISIRQDTMNLGTFFKRGVYIFLLTISIYAIIINMGILDLRLFISEIALYWTENLDDLKYQSEVYFNLIVLIGPIVLGIWSGGWVLEDLGLVHFKLPNPEKNKFFEIEPIHFQYNAVLKGYAGISTLVFYIQSVINIISTVGDITFSLSMVLLFIASSVPGYIIYWNVTRPFIAKRMMKSYKEIERITEVKYVIKE